MTPADAITRRRFVRDAGVAAAAAAGLADAPVAAARAKPRPKRRQTVAVFGGGIAGLTAAHELAERGFDVTVYERRAWGGKARSTTVPGTGTGGRKDLPGEHGFRTFFGFYQHTVDTMRRVPFGSNARGVFDNLVPAPQVLLARTGGHDLQLPLGRLDPRPYTPQEVLDLVTALLLELELPPQAVARFGARMAVYLSSCDARRRGEWERVTWRDFIGSDGYGADYDHILGKLFTLFAQASKAERTSAQFPGHVFEVIIYNVLGRGANGPTLRTLNRPTSEAFITPWVGHLQRLGVHLRLNRELTKLFVRRGRISGARISGPHGVETIHADWYVSAIPVERARRLWSRAILVLDPTLAHMHALDTAWMNGIQFYLSANRPLTSGFLACVDSPWACSGENHAQFWPADYAATYGDGRVHDCLSAASSDWTTPGVLFGKAARDCTPDEVAREVWEQIKRAVNDPGETRLTDDMLVSWHLDPGLRMLAGRLHNDDPLVLPTAGTWEMRPNPTTAIPNLMLCGDYLKGEWEVGNMDAASYNARRAANAILDRAGSRKLPAMTVDFTYRPPEWEPLKRMDDDRYRRGQPNMFDADLSLDEVKQLLGEVVRS